MCWNVSDPWGKSHSPISFFLGVDTVFSSVILQRWRFLVPERAYVDTHLPNTIVVVVVVGAQNRDGWRLRAWVGYHVLLLPHG